MIGRVLVSAGMAALSVGLATPFASPQAPQAGARLSAFGSCEQLVDHFKQRAMGELEQRAGEPVVGREETATAPAEGRDQGFSKTNVQEAGVDEPDIVKSDGRHVFALFNDRLRAVAVRSGAPRLVGTLSLPPGAREMLLYRDRLLVFSDGGAVLPVESAIAPQPPGGGQITEVDVGNPAAMRVVRTLSFEGRYVDSRLHGTTARIVLTSFPRGPEPVPLPAGQGDDPAEGVERQRQAIASSSLADWMPDYALTDRRSGAKRSGLLVPCRATLREPGGGGGDLVSVLTVNLSRGLPPIDADAMLISYADVVYASRTNLYVVSQQFRGRDSAQAIHKLGAGRAPVTAYRASGDVAGSLVNQFALSEHRGSLRVATTERRFEQRSESFVNVLAQRDGQLRRVGRVGNLGRGEAIQAVRYLGDVGFVVTFRRIDPLYTLDLTSPSRPRVMGQLKIRGYSAYLHPVGQDLLLGVGQDATAAGVQLGNQVSLFDISNLRSPRRLGNSRLGSGSFSEVEFDHHAFLYWPPARLAVTPVEVFVKPGGTPARAGAFGFRVGRGVGVERVGLVTHRAGASWAPVRRSLVVGDRLITVSERGVEAGGLATLAPRGFAGFPVPPQPRPIPR